MATIKQLTKMLQDWVKEEPSDVAWHAVGLLVMFLAGIGFGIRWIRFFAG